MLSSISAFLLLSVAIKIGAIPLEQSVVEIPLKFVTESKDGHPLRPMNDLYSKYMIGPIKGIGTPPQKLAKVIFTLSSGDFWVQNSEARKVLHCPYDNPVDGFDLHNSTSYESTRKKFETYSFKGNVTGKVGKDIINIGGPMIARTLFGNANNFNCFFVENSISGVMGLGWPQIANSNLSRSPVYDGLRRRMSKMFSIHIDSKSGEGSIIFGQSNRQNCQQNGWQYTPVSQRGFWQFGTTGFSIGSHRHNQFQQAILLESVPFILGQIDDINRLTIELGPSAGFSELSRTIIVGCKEFREGKLPNVTFHIGNGVDLDLVLAPEDYVDIDGPIGDICPTYFAYKADFYKTNVLPGNLSGINWIFGRPIMSKYCTSYHFDLRNIGFTLAKKQ